MRGRSSFNLKRLIRSGSILSSPEVYGLIEFPSIVGSASESFIVDRHSMALRPELATVDYLERRILHYSSLHLFACLRSGGEER